MNKLSNIAPCGLRLGGGLISDGEKINYLPIGNDLETGEPDYEKCAELISQECFPVIMYNGLILYSAGSSDEGIMFTGLNDDLKGGFAIYGLDEKNTVTKIPSTGGGSASQSIEYISIDNLTIDNPSVTVEGITDTIKDCYDRGVLPCIEIYEQLFYSSSWMGNTSPISTRAVTIYPFYSINDNGIDKVEIRNDICTLTEIKFQTVANQ